MDINISTRILKRIKNYLPGWKNIKSDEFVNYISIPRFNVLFYINYRKIVECFCLCVSAFMLLN